jgi:hypothetical protein
MTQETFTALTAALQNANFSRLFADVIGVAVEDYEDNTRFGLSFNVETDELQFISYITNEDKSWVNAFEQQNPCIIVGYVGAEDIIAGDPTNDIIERYKYAQPELI